METREIEARFLEVDKDNLVAKLCDLGATDHGEALLEEVIIYDPELKWLEERRFVRLRKVGGKTHVTYKENLEQTIDSAKEIEFEIEDFVKGELLFAKIGLQPYRRQEKRRHSFQLGEVLIDFDTWPRVPTYVELEGPSEQALQTAAIALGLLWSKAFFGDAREILEKVYSIPVGTMRWFTFERFE